MSPELIVLGVMIVALVLYALLGGADYGGGMWDLLAFGSRARRQRDAIARAIGPVWEANHVWLILVVVLLFAGFPPAFSATMTGFHLPLSLALVGIVLRGSTFVFRAYDAQRDAVHRRWSTIFGVSSLFTPFLLGMTLGGVASGAVQMENGVVTSGFVAGWWTPFAVACGLFAQGLFAFLAAVYLTVETADDREVQEDFRLRAILSGLSLAPAALGVALLAGGGAPQLAESITRPWVLPLLLATSLAAVVALAALYLRSYSLARGAAVVQVSLVLVGWAAAQYPWFLPGTLSISDAAAPSSVQWSLVVCLGLGALLLIPSLLYLFKVFKRGTQKMR